MADRIDIQAVREGASKATKGPWKTGGDSHWKREVRGASAGGIAWCGGYPMPQAHDDAAHIANCAPETILALCAVVEAAQQVAYEIERTGFTMKDTDEALRTALQPFKKD